MSTTAVKICGLTRLADAQLAADLGAWALGMVFHDASPRRCSLEQARAISAALQRRTRLCGVFVNATLDDIAHHVDELQLALVQLHGDEGPAFGAEVARRTGARVIKAARVAGIGDVRELERWHVDYHLADARVPGVYGGTGETFDWSLLRARRSKVPLILSGGLHPGNVAEAVAVVRPFAIDSASGTESAPGRKDPDLLSALFQAVGQADTGADAGGGADAGAGEAPAGAGGGADAGAGEAPSGGADVAAGAADADAGAGEAENAGRRAGAADDASAAATATAAPGPRPSANAA